jgi:hypothetical protein
MPALAFGLRLWRTGLLLSVVKNAAARIFPDHLIKRQSCQRQ